MGARDHRRSRRTGGDPSSNPALHTHRPSLLDDYRSRSHLRQRSPSTTSNDEEDLQTELHPLSHYVYDPRAMIEEIFSIIKGSKLDAMLTSGLRELTHKDLKEACLIQLEGMSKKRIRCILEGQEMDESSNTEEEDDEDEEICPDTEDLHSRKNASRSPSSPDNLLDEENDGELVLSLGRQEREETEKDGGDPSPSRKDSKDGRSERRRNEEESISSKRIETPPEPDGSKHSEMELLELEMRARAIKALLGKNEKASSEIKIQLNQEEEPSEGEDKKRLRREESLRRRKAREALETSEAKKCEETERREGKQRDMLRRIEEHALEMKDKEATAARKQEEEAERTRAKRKKEEERQKFLKWKEEKEAAKAKQSLKRSLNTLLRHKENDSSINHSDKLLPKRRAHDKKKYRSKNQSSKDCNLEHSPVSSEEDDILKRVEEASDIEDGELDSDGQTVRQKKRSQVFIADDSDEENIISSCSSEDNVKEEEVKTSKRSKVDRKKSSLKRTRQPEKAIDEDSIHDDLKDKQKLELERKEKILRDRLRRMQAFQQRTEILDKSPEPSSDEEESVKNESIDDGKKDNDFYNSYMNVKEKRTLIEEEEEVKEPKSESDLPVPPPAKKPMGKIDGIAEVAKLCETQGDFEEPSLQPKEDSSVIGTSRKSHTPPKRSLTEDEEEGNKTWADRWYQDKKVQKVVKESKAMSKVRNNIKLKIESQKAPPKNVDPERLEEEASTLPDVSTFGSIQQYAKIVGKSVDERSQVDPDDSRVSDYDDDEISLGGGDEDLWGDIMGTSAE